MTTRIRSAYAAAFALAAALVLVASAVSPGSAFAAVSAVYTASTNPTYENPATGAIEDAAGGSNVALAESMVTSIVYENALIERDTDGVMYASLRFKLADQISSISLEASEDGASYEPVEVVQMQTGTDSATSTATADYRIAIPGETATLRCSMDVIPMGRAVVYFITFGALQEGDADGTFVVSVTPGEGTDDAAPAAAAAASATASGDAGASGGTEDAEGEQAQSADDLTGASANEGVQEFDEEGREVTGGKQAEASLDGGTIATIVGVAVAVIAVAGVAVYAAYLRPKRARQ
uniref:heme-binding Shp domain-containing protein n=1 Tax=Eggerthella sinensis TaxID=242230 RepID=UPI0022E1BB20